MLMLVLMLMCKSEVQEIMGILWVVEVEGAE
jgi:hypothetical protein